MEIGRDGHTGIIRCGKDMTTNEIQIVARAVGGHGRVRGVAVNGREVTFLISTAGHKSSNFGGLYRVVLDEVSATATSALASHREKVRARLEALAR